MSSRDDWDEHWDAIADAEVLNPGQRMRQRLVAELIQELRPASLLDAGCGTGSFLAHIDRCCPQIRLAGIDPSRSGVALAESRVPGAEVVVGDLTESVPSRWVGDFEVVTCMEVLEHLDDPTDLCAALLTTLKPGASLVVTVPGGAMTAFDRHIGHRRHFGPADIQQTLDRVGFSTVVAWSDGFPGFNAYRAAVRARGDRLMDDVSGNLGVTTRLAMTVFDIAIRMACFRSRRGVQTIAVATR